jgi:3-dehydroquinate dehydratase II
MKILILNGPNLNLLGRREKSVYGDQDFDAYFHFLQESYPSVELTCFQSNLEGELIDKIHSSGFTYDGILINAGGYSHTSVAIRDAIAAVTTPVIEIHISNLLTREAFRHKSIIGPVCRGSIMGFGLDSYRLGIESFMPAR